VLELVDGLHQADVPLLDQVEELQAAVRVLLRDAHDQPQVRLDQLALGPAGPLLGLLDRPVGAAHVGDRLAGLLRDRLELFVRLANPLVDLADLLRAQAELLRDPARLGRPLRHAVAQRAELDLGHADLLERAPHLHFRRVGALHQLVQPPDQPLDRLVVELQIHEHLHDVVVPVTRSRRLRSLRGAPGLGQRGEAPADLLQRVENLLPALLLVGLDVLVVKILHDVAHADLVFLDLLPQRENRFCRFRRLAEPCSRMNARISPSIWAS